MFCYLNIKHNNTVIIIHSKNYHVFVSYQGVSVDIDEV
jgi:hypothetical protein